MHKQKETNAKMWPSIDEKQLLYMGRICNYQSITRNVHKKKSITRNYRLNIARGLKKNYNDEIIKMLHASHTTHHHRNP